MKEATKLMLSGFSQEADQQIVELLRKLKTEKRMKELLKKHQEISKKRFGFGKE